jgi:hypothetical protein
MAHNIVKEEPSTFRFPIKETDEESKMKKSYLKKILIHSSLSLMYFAEATTMCQMPRN